MALSKKTLALLAATTLGFGLVACADSDDNGTSGSTGAAAQTDQVGMHVLLRTRLLRRRR